MNDSGQKELELLRHTLHRHPGLSGHEETTAQLVEAYLLGFDPDDLVTGLGGYGLAAVFDSGKPGPTVLVRSELDGLPIQESDKLPYHSRIEGASHKCGHDGHMAIVAGLAPRFRERSPAFGRVVLLFQPSEETGEGALAVVNDPGFARITPDFSLSLHNLPGFPLGAVIVKDDIFASASTGLEFHLTGVTSHASEPEKGKSPVRVLWRILEALDHFSSDLESRGSSARLTIIHSRLGEAAFGTAPGTAVVMVTVRASDDKTLREVKDACTLLVRQVEGVDQFQFELIERDLFSATWNDAELNAVIRKIATQKGHTLILPETPFTWSEDFGNFSFVAPSAMFGFGAGEEHPPLHHTDYDFPDALLMQGCDLMESVIREVIEQHGRLRKETGN